MKPVFDIGNITPVRYFFVVAMLLGLLFGLTESEGETFSDVFRNVCLWVLHTLVSVALLLLSHLMLHRIRGFDRLNPWGQLLLSGILGVVLFTPFAFVFDHWFNWRLDSYENVGMGLINEMTSVAPPFLAGWLAMNAPWLLGFRVVRRDLEISKSDPGYSSEALAGSPLGKIPFLALLPEDLREIPWYLKAELHYLKVVTPKGSALVLYNLKDAVEELREVEGIFTHRSYWVNKSAVEGLAKKGRQGLVLLNNNESVPVSRSRWKAVERFLG